MTIHLTTEQEQRIQAIIHSGAYETVQDVVDAAIAAIEQRAVPGFDGTETDAEVKPPNMTEISQSAGVLVAFHKFTFLDVGDLTDKEMDLACPLFCGELCRGGDCE